MAHLDPELLALLGLGEEDAATAEERLHLRGCPECRAEVRRYRRPGAAARTDDVLRQPGPRVWAGIADALELDEALRADPLGAEAPALRAVEDVQRAAPRPAVAARPRRRLLVVALAAAAAVLLVGGAGVGLLVAQPKPRTLATATLDAFPQWPGARGTAVLERLPDGREVVAVTTTVQPQADTDHEVWLMTAGAKRLVSLGLLHGTSGTFAVPAGIDLGRYRLVDVSDEPRDGNPAHSGDSIVRGALRS
jgi:hypothetical protein